MKNKRLKLLTCIMSAFAIISLVGCVGESDDGPSKTI